MNEKPKPGSAASGGSIPEAARRTAREVPCREATSRFREVSDDFVCTLMSGRASELGQDPARVYAFVLEACEEADRLDVHSAWFTSITHLRMTICRSLSPSLPRSRRGRVGCASAPPCCSRRCVRRFKSPRRQPLSTWSARGWWTWGLPVAVTCRTTSCLALRTHTPDAHRSTSSRLERSRSCGRRGGDATTAPGPVSDLAWRERPAWRPGRGTPGLGDPASRSPSARGLPAGLGRGWP